MKHKGDSHMMDMAKHEKGESMSMMRKEDYKVKPKRKMKSKR
ncbi:MAG TPA: hypothetical protein VJ044_14085 [Candidatus Hodarchaeales archaeon]|nr:hypothetical protein [Candidatus Hodarchaeales archaeon]